jgi:Tfp pilus assembly protein PilP
LGLCFPGAEVPGKHVFFFAACFMQPALLRTFEVFMHFLHTTLLLVLCALAGCSKGSSSPRPDDLQQRLSMYTYVAEMHHREIFISDYAKELYQCAELLPETFSDPEAAKDLLKELQKNRKDKQAIKKITKQLADLLPLPEKYAASRLKDPFSETVDN